MDHVGKPVDILHIGRLIEILDSLAILRKVRELDSQDRMGITRLIGVIENGGREEEE